MSASALHVEFQNSEYGVHESIIEKDISFTITNPITDDAHFIVLAVTYEEYDMEYPELNATYPGLAQFTQNNEYDQAERKYVVH